MNDKPHLPVLYQEVIKSLQPHNNGCYVDGTVGAGGHAFGILEQSSPDGALIGLDLDPQALALSKAHLQPYKERVTLIHASYTTIDEQLVKVGWNKVDGILVDLGLSSMQLDTSERGFSFRFDAPLDMRFNPDQKIDAGVIINEYDEKELTRIFWLYGEERQARRISSEIVSARPLHTTGELAKLVTQVKGKHWKKTHPATQVFQALRIAVNNELDAVQSFLPKAVEVLKPGGRLAVISFHSLEDRIVKQFFAKESKDCLCPPEQIICSCGHKAIVKRITKKPITASEKEVSENPRARSAHLRVVEKLG